MSASKSPPFYFLTVSHTVSFFGDRPTDRRMKGLVAIQRPPRKAWASALSTTRTWVQRQDTTLIRRPPKTFHRPSAFKTDRSDLVEFLREDLDHLFDDQGIDVTKYDDRVTFRDPITSYGTIQGYVANIKFLKTIFRPKFTLHDIKQTGDDEITYVWIELSERPDGDARQPRSHLHHRLLSSFRWTMDMVFTGIGRELVFTGTSKLGVNPLTNRFCSHIDTWDAIRNQEYFSPEAFLHMLGQLAVQRTEALRGEVLMKRAEYEVVRRDGRVVAVPVGGTAKSTVLAALERDGTAFDRVEPDGTAVLADFAFPPL